MSDLDERTTELELREHQHEEQGRARSSPLAELQRTMGNRRLVQLRRTMRKAVQARGALDGPDVHAAAERGIAGNTVTLPHLEAIQRAFGHHDVREVRAHVGGASADAADAMGAIAYASGDDVAFSDSPDLHLAAHEAAHIVQQRGGVRLSDGVGSAGDEYERHADEVADRVVRGESAQNLLDQYAHRGAAGGRAVQRVEPGENAGGGGDGQCSEGPADTIDVTRATSAMRAGAQARASALGTDLPNAALDAVSQQITQIVNSRQPGSTSTETANIYGRYGVSHQYSIRADVQRRRVGVCGQQRINDAQINQGRTRTGGDERRIENTDQRSQQQTLGGNGGQNAENAPSGQGSYQSQTGGQQTRTQGNTRTDQEAANEGLEGQGDAMIQEEEYEYTVTWTVETRVADRRPPEGGLFGGGNDFSLNNTIAGVFDDSSTITTRSTSIGSRRENSTDLTPGARPQQPRRRQPRRPQRITSDS